MKEGKKLYIAKERCKSCSLCVNACPKKVLAIGNTLNQQGYNVVEVAKPEDCIACGFCRLICPDIAISVLSTSS